MKIAVLCQEEPVFLGPFLCEVIRLRPGSVCAVFIAGHRTGGEKSGGLSELLESLATYWYVFEPTFFIKALFLQVRSRLLGRLDPRSVAGLARRTGIPVYHVGNPNGRNFRKLLAQVAPDAVLNQSELLLKKKVLAIPRFGFLNRHASLLPRFRGRFACFWAHFHEPPSYGVTIHLVDEGLDTGDVILQHEFEEIEPTWTFPRVMEHIQSKAPSLFWKAVDLLETPGFVPRPQEECDDEPLKFPGLEQARLYAETMRRRRRGD